MQQLLDAMPDLQPEAERGREVVDLSNDDLTILISCVSSKIGKFDETWGNAKWRREQKVHTDSSFYTTQAAARERAGSLLSRLKAEQTG